MISLMFAIIGSALGLTALGFWFAIRQRPALLNPQTLIIEPPAELWLERLDEAHWALCGDSAMPIAVYSGAHPSQIDRTKPLEIDVDDAGTIVFNDPKPLAHRYFDWCMILMSTASLRNGCYV